ncbi:MAG TPA: squalene/phytoene synthase family protein [Hyphomicrobium sp.]|nr:squalene/phytoene synthase family protein [Hyphomicrobium sp.]
MEGAGDGGTRSDFDVVRDSARTHEQDRYLAALLAPARSRRDLVALAAFTGEVKKISHVVSEPHLAEIRLQWWRDAVLAPQAAATGNPVADAFIAILAGREDLHSAVDGWLDAVVDTFYRSAPEGEAEFLSEIETLEGAPFLLAARICGAQPAEDLLDMSRAAGRAYGLARLGLTMAQSLARGRVPLPQVAPAGWRRSDGAGSLDQAAAKAFVARYARAALDHVRPRFRHGSPAQRAAMLPLALVEPYLRACEKQGHDLMRDIGDVAPLVRVWRIWRAHLTGRL